MKKDIADVCLVLEGTYPFVPGGVSSWVHTLVENMPHLTFSILHISPHEGFYGDGFAYEVPSNVIDIHEVFLTPRKDLIESSSKSLPGTMARIYSLLRDLRDGQLERFSAYVLALRAEARRGRTALDLIRSLENWEILVDSYRREAPDESFLNFFWTWCYAQMPMLSILMSDLPRARMYHTVSTGYAGALAAAAAVIDKAPMILTEHGIYTKERRIEINKADWIVDWDPGEVFARKSAPFFEQYWVEHFEMLSKICYANADSIYTLYAGNTQLQVRDGASPEKIHIIPNGIDLDRYGEAAGEFDRRESNLEVQVGFIGRVTPVKDVKSLLRAFRLVNDEEPGVRLRILGPMEESPDYATECRQLTRDLGLEETVTYEGRVQTVEKLPELDIVVLTSISEAQPLVLLEAGAVGLPIVASDVGCCTELLYGRDPADRSIGAGGIITPIATPGETAKAILRLARDEDLRHRMGKALQARVRRYYSSGDMVGAYRELYEQHSGKDVA